MDKEPDSPLNVIFTNLFLWFMFGFWLIAMLGHLAAKTLGINAEYHNDGILTIAAVLTVFASLVTSLYQIKKDWYEYGLREARPKMLEAEGKIREADKLIRESESRVEEARRYAKVVRSAFNERAKGFESIHKELARLDEMVDSGLSDYLVMKRRPAFSSAEVVRRETKMRRAAELEAKTNASIIEYYEQIYPDLIEIRENELSGGEEESIDYRYTNKERSDTATKFLSRAEYLKLSVSERNQKALDRYWKRKHAPRELGRMYERYVGYLYESQGYIVDYSGINNGVDDLGRDLVCRKGKTTVIVQCKYWSQYKNVYENRIFQHFGTVFEYKLNHKEEKVIAAFYTTTKLSAIAKSFAKEMKMILVEEHKFDKKYPCIKCNIGSDGSRIYHLPFDQQYDNIKIDIKKGEFFASSVKEAESAGFRRAYRWHGERQK